MIHSHHGSNRENKDATSLAHSLTLGDMLSEPKLKIDQQAQMFAPYYLKINKKKFFYDNEAVRRLGDSFLSFVYHIFCEKGHYYLFSILMETNLW